MKFLENKKMTKEEKTSQVYALIREIKDAELLGKIGDLAYREAKDITRRKADKIGWYVGLNVQLLPKHQGTNPYNEVGEVIKVNTVKLKVKFPAGIWNVPKAMLRIKE